jgi:hypothetical protein
MRRRSSRRSGRVETEGPPWGSSIGAGAGDAAGELGELGEAFEGDGFEAFEAFALVAAGGEALALCAKAVLGAMPSACAASARLSPVFFARWIAASA